MSDMKQVPLLTNRYPAQPGFHSDKYSLDEGAMDALTQLFSPNELSDDKKTELRFRIRSIAMLSNQYRKTSEQAKANYVTSILLKRHPKEGKTKLLPYDLIEIEFRILKNSYKTAITLLNRIQKQNRIFGDYSLKTLDELFLDLSATHTITIQEIKTVWKDKYLAAIRPNYNNILKAIKAFMAEPSYQDLNYLIKSIEPLNDALEYVDSQRRPLKKGRPLSWENIVLKHLEKLFLDFNGNQPIKRTAKLIEVSESQSYLKDVGIFHDIVKTFFNSMGYDNSDHSGLIRKYITAKQL